MKIEFLNSLGKQVLIESLELERVRKISHALLLHPFAEIIEIRKHENGNESIICRLDLEVPSSPKTDVRENEDVVIICNASDFLWPEVVTLRQDFPAGLPHTNSREVEYPVSICYSEEIFSEVKFRFNAFLFVEKIRKWFELTAIGSTHSENQPLEPFFLQSGYAILKSSDIYENQNQGSVFSTTKLNENLIKVKKGVGSDGSICCLKFDSLPIEHGTVRRQPSSFSDLVDIIKFEDTDLLEMVKNRFNLIREDSDIFKLVADQRLGLLVIIPKKRTRVGEVESFDPHLFVTHKTLSEIALELGIWHKQEDYLVPIVGSTLTRENVAKIKVEYYSVIFDFDRNIASLLNDIPNNDCEYAIIGAGALGSQVLNNFGREGFGKWLIIDHDILLPHNLARHYLTRKHIGKSKSESVSKELNSLFDEGNSSFADSISTSFLSDNQEMNQKIQSVDAIIDMSTSIAVERKLALDLPKEVKARRISSFLNPNGTELVLLVEDKHRKTRLDQLEMEYYRHISNDSELFDHLTSSNIEKIRYASNSCRDVTSRINQEDISLFSAIASKAIRKSLDKDAGMIKIWKYNQESLDVVSKEFEPSEWIEITVDTWKLVLDKWVYAKINEYRNQKLPKETGGVLIGSYDFDRKIVYIVDSLPAPKDSIEKTTTFLRGIDGLFEKVDGIKNVTRNELNYIGEWHSHPPKASTNPSDLDIIYFKSLRKELFPQGYPTLMMIVGDQNFKIIISES